MAFRAWSFLAISLLCTAVASDLLLVVDGLGPGCEDKGNGVEFCTENPSWQRATRPEEFTDIFKDNIDDDLAYWREGRELKMKDLVMPNLALSKFTVLFIIKNQEVIALRNQNISGYTFERAERLAINMRRYAAEDNLTLPDTLFFFNTLDWPPCLVKGPVGGCTAPVFTMFKRWPGEDREILLPHFGRTFGNLYHYPWEKKDPRVMLRARFQSSMGADSSRLQLAELSAHDPELVPRMDVGIVQNRKKGLVISPKAMKPYIPLDQHTRWKFLINADGHTASSRLGQLLMMGSVVMKSDSPWIEYYYRSLKVGHHCLEWNFTNLKDLVKMAQDPANDEAMKEMGNVSQHFGYRFLSQQAKVIFTREALLQYNTLFSDMTSFMASFDPYSGPGGTLVTVAQVLELLNRSDPLPSESDEVVNAALNFFADKRKIEGPAGGVKPVGSSLISDLFE